MRRTSLLLTSVALAAALPALAQSPAKPSPAAKPAAAAPAKPGAGPAAAAPTPPAGAVLLSVKDVMRHIVNPAAEAFWARSGEVDDEKGANDRIPKAEDDANWKVTMDSSAQLVEAGNRLLLDPRVNDASGAWKKYAIALTNAGLAGMAASQAKNHDKTNDAGSAMYDACFQCHGRYIVRPKDSLYKHDIDQDFKDTGRSPK